LKESVAPLTVLLVEDNLINRKVALSILKKSGHRVSTANDGAEALNLLEQQHFDAILMDMQMPVLDGLATTRLIREKEAGSTAHIPIIAMTANAMQGDRETCLAAGMDDYLAKPIKAPELREKLEAIAAKLEASQSASDNSQD
ncbi:MAG: response regulator, partial [Betaproteobacteria bacterium]